MIPQLLRIRRAVFDHISIGVTDLDRSVRFYDATLGALGYVRLWLTPRAAGYGLAGFEGEAPFALIAFADEAAPMVGLHLAFSASNREAVSAFHAAALASGGCCDGPPGIRENYDPGYYSESKAEAWQVIFGRLF
jgi:catechol 2,3-dioxygenase-like lactoylglutathione lyase family enzyme